MAYFNLHVMGKPTEITIELKSPIATINRNIYGHFAEHLGTCIYEGLWVGSDTSIPNYNGFRKDVVDALKKIKIPVLRWPGGCFADDYHWLDGIGPREQRPVRINRWWNSKENNHVGTHEFLELCKLLECEPYICGNVGSGTVKEMSDWLEYLNCSHETTWTQLRTKNGHPKPYKVHYWGVGNENWGCGGNMSAQYYANEVKRYSTYLSSYSDVPLYKIACGPNSFDYQWTEKFFAMLSGKACDCGGRMQLINAFSLHYYCGTAGTATQYNEMEWYILLLRAMAIEELIVEHRKIMDKYDPSRKIDLICDEWGTWHKPIEGTESFWLKQYNTIRDALVAALSLDIFNNHADKIKMANIAQTVNVLQAMVLTDGEKMVCTPTYYVYQMYADHQDATAVKVNIETDEVGPMSVVRVAGSCSIQGDSILLSLVNTHISEPAQIRINWSGSEDIMPESWDELVGKDIFSMNTYEDPMAVVPKKKELIKNIHESLELLPASVNVLKFKKKK